MSKHRFKTEVSRLLHLIIHSLYSHPEIFLRELISNASDALDRLKYLTLTDPEFKGFAFMPRIDIAFDPAEGKDGPATLSVSDSGIGMDAAELETNLGTIANSGTRRFLESLGDGAPKDTSLIGQFGVGFYSAFMVADRVLVDSRRAGGEASFRWQSDGQGSFEIKELTGEQARSAAGTTVTLQLNERGKEYASGFAIERIVRKYSNHVPFPIYLRHDDKVEQINSASALWRRPKSEITDEEYREFYKTVSHDTEDPLHFVHTQAEGALEYSTLLYIPKQAPFDLFFPSYRPGVKLYVKRVFITDDDKQLMPTYLRFLQGVIDSEDLPLNVSREMLQENQVLKSIRSASVKRVLGELEKMAQNTPERYEEFWKAFGLCVKEGAYQDLANRESLLELLRYKSTTQEGLTSLKAYKERMSPEQKAIYYLTGGDEQRLRGSPLLEGYAAKGIEVLIMDDEIDELVASAVGRYQDLELKAVNRGGAAEEIRGEGDKDKEKALAPLLKKMKKILGDEVKEVRASSRLADSPSCIVVDENDPTLQMQHLIKALGQKDLPATAPILEVNPDHPIVTRLVECKDEAVLEDVTRLLLEQALILEGAPLPSAAEFARRLNRVMAKAV